MGQGRYGGQSYLLHWLCMAGYYYYYYFYYHCCYYYYYHCYQEGALDQAMMDALVNDQVCLFSSAIMLIIMIIIMVVIMIFIMVIIKIVIWLLLWLL